MKTLGNVPEFLDEEDEGFERRKRRVRYAKPKRRRRLRCLRRMFPMI